MSVIVKAQGAPASQWVYLDNVTNYTKRRSKRLTSHPIEASSNGTNTVTDHAIKNNQQGSLSGTISPWDFHLAGGTVGRNLTDSGAAVTSVGTIKVDSTISDYLPSVVSQYTNFNSDVKSADILVHAPTMTREAYLQSVTQKLVTLDDTDSLIDIYFSDYSGEGAQLITGVVITSLVFSEDTNTGDTQRVDISFEQPTFAYISTTDVPQKAVSDDLSTQQNGGKVTGTTPTEESSTAYSSFLNLFR